MKQTTLNDYYPVLATDSLTEEKTFVLKHDNTFANFNLYGDVSPFSVQGIFHEGTRFLSKYQLKIEGKRPLFLSSNLKERNENLLVDLTNPDIMNGDRLKLEKDIIHIKRKKTLWNSVCYEQIRLHNFGLEEVTFNIDLEFDADFSDIFEIRGTKRLQRGNLLPVRSDDQSLILSYTGLDNTERSTKILMEPEPDNIVNNRINYCIRLHPGEDFYILPTISFEISGKGSEILSFRKASKKHKRRIEYIDQVSCSITTSNEHFDDWINRSRTDLITVITETPYGPYPYAGIPWYDTPFGRDGIITALECLWISPEIARGVLNYLAVTQAKEKNNFRDAEPGKILHETRNGEMAVLNEVPFKQYYGTIDATPLFIVLAGAYFLRTNDITTIQKIWENIERALDWIEDYGDFDNDLFVEYQRKEESGLFNQGWKDSHDSISNENGEIAELPVALCEVQGYVYDAWKMASILANEMDMKEKAGYYLERAEKLQQKFREEFWSADKSTFYLALASGKKPCNVVASNAGHCLFSGIASEEQARNVAQTLLSKQMFTGWGIRTLSSEEIRYNPASYHNGSVWPHDNALIAYGFSRYGLKEEVKKLARGLFDTSFYSEGRLPELFCGFRRKPEEAPVNYPVACSPQAWSVATVFMLIQALLGLEINEHEDIIRFFRPVLPDFIDKMIIKKLKFKDYKLNLEFIRTGESVSIQLLNKDIPVKLEIIY